MTLAKESKAIDSELLNLKKKKKKGKRKERKKNREKEEIVFF